MTAGPRLLTYSAGSMFSDCTERYNFRYVQGVEPNQTQRALNFGDCTHKALEAYWRARKDGAESPYDAMMAAIPSRALDVWERARLRVMLTFYAAAWGSVACKVLAVEEGFNLPLYAPDGSVSTYWRRAGKMDLVLEFPGREVAVTEHKSSSQDPSEGSPYATRLLLDEQISNYYAAARAMGLKPTKIIYDVLKKPRREPLTATPEEHRYKKNGELRKNARVQDETPEEYEDRLYNELDPNEIITKLEVTRFDHEIVRAEQDLWRLSERMRQTIEGNLSSRNSRACLNYYGGTCPYWDVCTQTASIDDPRRFRRLKVLHPELENNHH